MIFRGGSNLVFFYICGVANNFHAFFYEGGCFYMSVV